MAIERQSVHPNEENPINRYSALELDQHDKVIASKYY